VVRRPLHYDPEHPLFSHPSGETRLWRYLDFTKLVALLESRALFLPRADRLGDAFEGSVSPATVALREGLLDLAVAADPEQRNVQRRNLRATIDGVARDRREQASFTYVSCWHASEHESAGMWAQYVPTGHGVAVQTTFEQLQTVLPRHEPYEGGFLLYLGLVHYLDYTAVAVPEGNAYAPFVCKRQSFEHERELRLISMDSPYEDAFDEAGRRILKTPIDGLSVPVDLDQLLEGIYLRPGTPNWISTLVRALTVRAGVSAEVVVSSLDEDPVY